MKICGRPFYSIAMHPIAGGLIYVACCPSWLKYPYDKYRFRVKETNKGIDFEEVWNSNELLEFRKSILDGSYRYCDKKACPNLVSEKLMDIPEKATQNIQENNPRLNYFPIQIAANIDHACNLQCPSCRSVPDTCADPKTYQRFIDILKSGAEDIFFNASGELFFNPYLLRIMKSFSSKDYPSVKIFRIITNGTLLNKTLWYSLSDDFKSLLKEINISVDTFSEKTYSVIRPGGSFTNLQKNLKNISDLRRSGEIVNFRLLFVLQKNNFRELVDIVKGSLDLNPDGIEIRAVANWGSYSDTFFKENIRLPSDFQSICSGDILEVKKLINTSGVPLLSDIL
jgi:sulfatase maturation enzyme AslB (radical SAM superfamily)